MLSRVRAHRPASALATDLCALAVYTLLLILRAPWVWRGRFWAEEGAVFFSAACSKGLLASLFLPHLGYYAAVANLAATLAARAAPLEQAPLVTTLIAAGVQLLPAGLIAFTRIDALPDARWRALAMGLLLVSLPSEEIWLNSANSGHYLAVCAGILLVANPPAARARWLALTLLVLAGLSGIDANLLTPFFWLRAWRERSRPRLEQAVALSLCALIQALVVVIAPSYGLTSVGLEGHRSPRLDPQILAHAVFAKDILLPFAGRAFTEQLSTSLSGLLSARHPKLWVSLVAMIWAGLFGLAVHRSRQWQPRILFGAALFVVVVSFTASIEASQPRWQLSHVSALGAGRYYYLPNFFLGLSLLMIASGRSALPAALRGIALALALWMLAVGSNEFFRSDARRWFFTGPDWRSQVAAWRRGESSELGIWPAPWKLSLATGCPLQAPHP
jgi:hypothetical protein